MTDHAELIAQAQVYVDDDTTAVELPMRGLVVALAVALAESDAENTELRKVIADIALHRHVIRGAQFDMLGKRPDMDAMEEIALSEREIDDLLAAAPGQEDGR